MATRTRRKALDTSCYATGTAGGRELMSLLKPSDFYLDPFMSVFGNADHESIARGIMAILVEDGDEWREVTWEEYRDRYNQTDDPILGDFRRFPKVSEYCQSPEKARTFSRNWEHCAATAYSYVRFIEKG
jgi:hypothetical protein